MRSKALHIFSLLLLTSTAATTAMAQSPAPSTTKPAKKVRIIGNVYGGGDQAAVQGNTTVEIKKGQFCGDIFGGGNGVLNDDGTVKASADVGLLDGDNKLVEGTGETHVNVDGGEVIYEGADNSHHNIYGGGNLACIVQGNTHVYMIEAVTSLEGINTDEYEEECRDNVALPHFSVFGGGYGKHAEVSNNAFTDVNLAQGSLYSIIGGGMNGPVGGSCQVHVGNDPETIVNRVYGGGFYAPCHDTQLLITRGTILENVFGGSVMGNIWAENTDPTQVATKTVIGLKSSDGESVVTYDTHDYAYADHKNQISIGGDVYGANDVSGTVNGVASLTIYGGNIKGDVYGAGNGDHLGYYVPSQLLYDKGEHTNNYLYVEPSETVKGYTYVSRPQTIGGVEITLDGNDPDERVNVLGQVFGGGNSCTVGKWDDALLSSTIPASDNPAYFVGGGKIEVNFGSHVTIGRTHKQLDESDDADKYLSDADGTLENVSGLYMGCSGRHLAAQDMSDSDNYYHHYYDATAGKYFPGFATEDSFLAYMNNILVKSDNVSIHYAEGSDDVWISNFVGGGFRGSMKAMTKAGQFHYILSRGVTIGHSVIGGAFNTDVEYKEYVDNGTETTETVRYRYNGGMLSEKDYGTAKADNDRIDRIMANYTSAGGSDVNKDFAGVSETAPVAFNRYKGDALVYLELENRLEVEYLDEHVHGGNVYGGCFASGRVEGDVWTDYRCYQEGKQSDNEDFNLSDKSFNNAKDFANNFAMMLFGAGYGSNTNIIGSAYVRVLHPETNPSTGVAYGYPRLYNVFGGSFEGKVEGNTNVYFNAGKYGYVTGAIYGGGCNGYVGGKTYLELAGGYVDEAYGGARNANVGGGTHVWAYDGSARWWGEDVIHSNGNPMAKADAEKAPLFIGKLYGGTDISGQICTDEEGTYAAINGYKPYFSAQDWTKELYIDGDNTKDMINIDTYLQVGGVHQSNKGFPIIGAVYAAGNGEKTEAFFGGDYTDAKLPTQHTTLMEVTDGNIVYAFGGGNKATVTDQNYILVNAKLEGNHKIEDLGVQMYDVMKKRILSVGVDCYDEKLVDSKKVLDLKNASIQRLFGGNNIATMDIQPKWQLASGRINNVYSGGNMGNMTYYNPVGLAATKTGNPGEGAGRENNADGSNSNYTPRGLCITIEHPDIHIGSLYGGCRLSDVIPTPKAEEEPWPAGVEGEDYYGATVNITDGYIENVYGGNDISGTVHYGTNVNISGAVSGNVYGSGNGFYLYKWDDEATEITEHLLNEYDTSLSANDKTLCYIVPGTPGANNTQKLFTINDARPSVEKAFLNIAGLEHYPVGDGNPKRVAYVKGNVFCGGNASTIIGEGSFSKFKIGSYVSLNGVFMGSDGESFTKQDEIERFAKLNAFDMSEAPAEEMFSTNDEKYYDNLLDVYMMAVEMKAMPKDFNLNLPLKEAHIGTYCGGGNRGSMLVDRTVSLPFHHDIIIYDKIVAACLNANVTFNQNGKVVKSFGGFSREVDVVNNGDNGNTKLNLEIASQFVPLVMDVPADKLSMNTHNETFAQAQAHDFMYDNRSVGEKYSYEEFNELFEGHWTSQEEFERDAPESIQWKVAPNLYAPSCNIYGGCYQTGEVEGDVILNLHSNMLRYVNQANLEKTISNNIACFNVYGAGFGQDSHVWGNVKINMDRSLDTSTMGEEIAKSTLSQILVEQLGGYDMFDVLHGDLHKVYASSGTGYDCTYPSFNNVFGGGRNGKLIGNSEVAIRNGFVYSDVAGGCYASDMYGSTHVIVGYPTYYRCLASGVYTLDRGDKWNTDREDANGEKVVKPQVYYLKGDLVPANVYQQIIAKESSNASKFEGATVAPSSWDDVYVKIGRGVYGGGYSLANSTSASAGAVTTHKLSDVSNDLHPHNFDSRYGIDDITNTNGYGGNSNIMVGDQKGGTRDHIHISTLKPSVAKLPKDRSINGKFILEADGHYTQQGEGTAIEGVTYYNLAGDGGIYGDGHLTFCEGFRAADVTRYGYAEGTPQYPVLMNTFQRIDLLSLNDCCLMLQGAQDFATDQIDATIYSITRVNEMRMNSTLDKNVKLGEITTPTNAGGAGINYNEKQQRNYLAFYNNVHYLGSLVTNDVFDNATDTFHDANGGLGSQSYKKVKADYIDAYTAANPKDGEPTTIFKQRNVGTARNAIGVNNGYCLRIQNQEYVGSSTSRKAKTYYGPIVGVCEIKLLTLVQGEGGGYVYADNIHEKYGTHGKDEYFLNTSGNFVFPGIIHSDPSIGNQYIVDDCFIDHFGTHENITKKDGELDEAHYWYVEGNRYFYNTTLTGFTYQEPLTFDLINNDPNVILSGMEKDSKMKVKKIEWLSTYRDKYEPVLWAKDAPKKEDDYEFDMQVVGTDTGTEAWTEDMLRDSSFDETALQTIGDNKLPQFNIRLQDKLDNSGDAKYINHLDEPELVKIYLEGTTKDSKGIDQKYEYTITLNIIYLQGPSFKGGVVIDNCALPGERIGFSTKGLEIKAPELMPVTAHVLKVVPLSEFNETKGWIWDSTQGEIIPESDYSEHIDGYVTGTIPAHYKDNEYNIAYIFTAGGYDFPVLPMQSIAYATASEYNTAKGTSLTVDEFKALSDAEKVKSVPVKEERMIVVHNYHRMKDVVPYDLQVEAMTTVPYVYADASKDKGIYSRGAEAKLYIEDEEDLRAFVGYLNMATEGNTANIPVGLEGLDIILQKDVMLTSALPTISEKFAGTFHGDGYHINLNGNGVSLFGDNLTGKVYNLGLVGGTITTVAGNVADASGIIAKGSNVTNSYEYSASDAFTYGKNAYGLSHYFTPTNEGTSTVADADNYVKGYYGNGDYQYATTDYVWSLRTGAPHYNQVSTQHDIAHTHDAARWQDTDADDSANPDVLLHTGYNKPLYDGTLVIGDSSIMNELDNVVGAKRGLPENYANDYLFFGQHLDLNNADAYPVHINPVANGDANKAKGGNRVYKTSGFYRSAEDNGFYYNRDAWALQPTLTAIDFTVKNTIVVHDDKTEPDLYGYTLEGDKAHTTPVSFNVDSNADHSADGYDHETYGYVTQNLLVYREHDYTHEPDYTGSEADYEGIWGEGKYADNTPESSVRYHLLRNVINLGNSGSDQKSRAFETDYFHLVDCQDYWAPGEFFIQRRGWYEREPQSYRTVANGYNSSTAWEGLCLPFPFVTRVYGEQPGNELSHFYGMPTDEMIANPATNDRTLHHEYWLSGLTDATASEASFARPSLEGGDGLFCDSKQYGWTEYVLNNTYYKDLPNYVSDYGTRDDSNWYASSHTFNIGYPHITACMPYLVAFPGESFYEFDLTGQTLTFEYICPRRLDDRATIYIWPTGDDGNTGNMYAAVLGHPDLTTSAGSAKHVGTYLHVEDQLGVNAEGTAFEAGATILPFRTYMTSTASPSARRIVIRDGGTGTIETPEEEDVNIGDLSVPTMRIYGDGTTIVVESNYETDLRVYSTAGRAIRDLRVESGTNRFTGFRPDVYIVGGIKLRLTE